MNPVEFKDQNHLFTKPGHMKDEQCGSLPAKQHVIDIEGDKFQAIESVWELSSEELAEVNKSKRIRLRVIANGMPPVNLFAEVKETESPILDASIEHKNEILWPTSSSIARTKHIEEDNILEVEYNNGKTYHYKNFPSILWNDLKEAKSIGQYINKNVKGQFPEEEVSKVVSINQ